MLFFFKQKTAYEMRISVWSSDVCSSDLLLVARRDEISDLVTLELGISKADSLYEVGRAYDVFTLAGQLCIQDDGEIFSCDLTPHGKARKIFTTREPLTAISAITPFNHPLNMVAHKVAPSVATNKDR